MNPYWLAARQRKALELVEFAQEHGWDAQDVATNPWVRRQMINGRGMSEPSDETWVLVVTTLQHQSDVALMGHRRHGEEEES